MMQRIDVNIRGIGIHKRGKMSHPKKGRQDCRSGESKLLPGRQE